MTADTETPTPHLRVVDKLCSLPVVEQACSTSAGVYNSVKGSNSLVNWALESAEGLVGTAVGSVAPIATKFKQPISEVDATLCKGLDLLQEKVPIVKDQPGEIYGKAKTYVASSIPSVDDLSKASLKLRDSGWNKANELLTSRYGCMAMNGLDSTSHMADKYIDYYLPPTEGEDELHLTSLDKYQYRVSRIINSIRSWPHVLRGRLYDKISHIFNNLGQNGLLSEQDAVYRAIVDNSLEKIIFYVADDIMIDEVHFY